MNDERGQAVLIAAVVLAIAVVAIAGLRVAQERIAASATRERAGEAAVEAATAVVADAYAAARRVTATPTPDIRRVLADPALAERARAAANVLASLNGGTPVDSVDVRCDGGDVEVVIHVTGVRFRAGFHATACSPR